MKAKRYSPLLLLYDLFKLVRNSIFFVILLFVINSGSVSTFIVYGRILFFVVIGMTLFSMILKWFTHKYELDDTSFHLYKGLFSKSERTVPFSKIQNVNRHTSLFHRIFNVTSVSFETGMTGADAAVKFDVISHIEADRMEARMRNDVQVSTDDDLELCSKVNEEHEENEESANANRTIHFKPTKKDIFKASFTSLSFVALIPVLISLYFQINDMFHVEEEVWGILEKLTSSWWMVAIIVIVLVIASVTFGIIRAFMKYGNYEITSDDDRIYITKGLIEKTAFSISKEKVQAIEIKQSPMKRLLGLAEVKLSSAGGINSTDDTLEINSLYPFLPQERAYEMISEILPGYKVTQKMTRLPKKTLWVRLLRPSWFWIVATAALFYFKPSILAVEQAWWIGSVALLIVIGVLRLLDFYNTRYVLNDHFIQFKTGSLTTSLFVSKREKVIEVKVTRNMFQQFLGLASIETINRAKPVQYAGVNDVPSALAGSFYRWYKGRRSEIKVVQIIGGTEAESNN